MNLNNLILFEKEEKLFILIEDRDDVLIELEGLDLIHSFKTEKALILSKIKENLDQEVFDTNIHFLDGHILIQRTAKEFEEYELRAYAKFPTSDPCPASSGPTLADDGPCLDPLDPMLT